MHTLCGASALEGPAMTKIIGLLGGKGAGKTTAANYLFSTTYSCQVFAIADELKMLVGKLFRLSHQQLHGTQEEKAVVDSRWGLSPRALMERTGDALQATYGQAYQVERVIEQIQMTHDLAVAIVSDVRFVHEAQALRDVGAILWRIHYSPSVQVAAPEHESEKQWMLPNVDFEIRPIKLGVEHLHGWIERGREIFHVD